MTDREATIALARFDSAFAALFRRQEAHPSILFFCCCGQNRLRPACLLAPLLSLPSSLSTLRSSLFPSPAMSLINVTDVQVLDNPTKFTNPFQFEITFECLPPGVQEGQTQRHRHSRRSDTAASKQGKSSEANTQTRDARISTMREQPSRGSSFRKTALRSAHWLSLPLSLFLVLSVMQSSNGS